VSARTLLRLAALSTVALGALVTGGATPQPAAAGYVIVVRADNPVASLPRAELSRLFLKRDNSWPGGLAAAPVDLVESVETRQLFSREVHQKPVAAIKAYWQQQIFSGRGTPPPERASEAQVLDYVRSNPGGIGYVSADTPLGSGLKALRVEP
jgi:ABC-type phosphate transport system substrate-binding protein